MIKRLIRWLARKDIAEAYEAAALVEKGFNEARVQLAKELGELEGMRRACEQVEDVIRQRDGDYVCRCDVERVRARFTLH